MQASPLVFAPSRLRKAAARSKPRAMELCAIWTWQPVSTAISKISRSAMLSASGGRVRACMIGSVRPAALASSVNWMTSSWSSLWMPHIRPVLAISRKAASMVGWSMRGKRTASYS